MPAITPMYVHGPTDGYTNQLLYIVLRLQALNNKHTHALH